MNRAAFSLMEVMLAASILVVALMATFSAIGTAAQTNRVTESEVRVLEELESLVERIQTTPFLEVRDYHDQAFDVHGVEPATNRTNVIIIQVIDHPTINNTLDVTITAGWHDITGDRSHSIRYLHVNRGT